MSIGKDWKERRKAARATNEHASEYEERKKQQREAQLAIGRIPGLIDQAFAKGEDSVRVLPRYLDFTDVACRNVERLVDGRHGDKPKAEDFAGTARIIFDWCRDNDLECFIRFGGKVPLNGSEYDLIAKPK